MVYYESQLMLDLMSEGTQVSRILALAATQDKVHWIHASILSLSVTHTLEVSYDM